MWKGGSGTMAALTKVKNEASELKGHLLLAWLLIW